MQAFDHGKRKQENREVGDDVQDPVSEVDGWPIDTVTCCNGRIPVLCDWMASEDE